MKHLYYIISIFIIVATPPCYSIKNPPKNSSNFVETDIIHTIKTIKRPQSIISFPNNIVAIEGIKECSIYDTTKKKEIHRIKNDEDIKCIAGHPTKPLLAILSETTFPNNHLRIYNIKTGNIISELSLENLQASLVFNPIDDTIITVFNGEFLCIFDCDTLDADNAKAHKLNIFEFTPHIHIAYNPKKNECALLSSKTITSFDTQKDFQFKTNYNNHISNMIDLLTYSSDGSLIIGKTYNHLYYIADSSSNKIQSYDNTDNNKPFHSVALSPISFIMASYNIKNNRIDYRNLKKDASIIASTYLPSYQNEHYAHQQYINFSLRGTTIFIALYNESLELKVPFYALYKPKTKEKSLFALCTLNNFFLQTNNNFPNDIKYLLIKTILERSQYSFTNY